MDVLPFLPLLGSGILLIGSVLMNIYNRTRPPIVPVVPPPPPPPPNPHSKSIEDFRNLYLSLRNRHKEAPKPSTNEDLGL